MYRFENGYPHPPQPVTDREAGIIGAQTQIELYIEGIVPSSETNVEPVTGFLSLEDYDDPLLRDDMPPFFPNPEHGRIMKAPRVEQSRLVDSPVNHEMQIAEPGEIAGRDLDDGYRIAYPHIDTKDNE